MNDTTRNCSYFRAQLSALLDDELGRSEKCATEEHLAACSPCSAEFRALKAMTGELAALPRAAVGSDFLVELRRRIDAGEPSASWAESLNWFRVNLTLGTAMTVMIGIVAFRSDTVREAARAPGAPTAVSDRALMAEARAPQSERQASFVATTVRKDADSLAGGGAPAVAAAKPVAPARDDASNVAGPAAQLASAVPSPAQPPARPAVLARAPSLEAAPAPESDSFQAESESLDDASGLKGSGAADAMPAAVESKRAPVRAKARSRASIALARAGKEEAAASPAAPMPSTGLARVAGLSSERAAPERRNSLREQASEVAEAPRAMAQDMAALKQGLQVGDLSGGAAGERVARGEETSRSEILARPGEGGGGLAEPLHATPGRAPSADEEQSAEKAVAASSFDPTVTGDSQVTHALLSHYFGVKAVETPEQSTRPRSDGSIVIKVTRLRAFLRTLRDQADTLSAADFQATSTSSFEFSVMVEGGQAGLEAVTAKLSSFPGAQPAGLMFERLGDTGRFAARVMVTVAPE